MTALTYHGAWDLELQEASDPAPPHGLEVLVRIHATGICGTDLGIVSGRYDARKEVVLGHESAGVVAAVGLDVRGLKPGDRVVIDPTYFCGQCRMCRTERPNHCEHKAQTETGVSSDGTFATTHKTQERFLHPIPGDLGFAEASLSEPLSCVLTGLRQLRLRADHRTLVLGGGPMGLLYALALDLRGITGVLVETSAFRRELASAILGDRWHVRHAIDVAIAELDGAAPCVDLVVDTTGALHDEAIASLARGGQFLTVGLRKSDCTLDMGAIADRSLSVVGSIDSIGTFGEAVHLIASGAVPAAKLVTHRIALADYSRAFSLLGLDLERRTCEPTARACKVVIIP